MERSVRNMKQMLRENVARFLEHADGREVIVSVTARLVKKQSEEQKGMEKNVDDEQSKRNSAKHIENTSSQISELTIACNRNSSSGINWIGGGKDRYHYGKE